MQSCEGEDSADSVVDHSMLGWPAPMDKVGVQFSKPNSALEYPLLLSMTKSPVQKYYFTQEPAFDSIIRGGQQTPQANVPVAPVNALPPNISAMLQAVQDPALQSILGQNVNTPPPTLKPEEAELYQVNPNTTYHLISLLKLSGLMKLIFSCEIHS